MCEIILHCLTKNFTYNEVWSGYDVSILILGFIDNAQLTINYSKSL